ncbi:programmed cell death protein 2 isoform X2 [Phymastichus coffea]|uniref:programmed cell death protein 2 isoform X2 n=1 Tax=Phymastichus coffea TaxID=108790 RepID=UPI00273AA310|nr:programmed cell death protein 2 isoform X2 [Phymastichus coffea]
MKDIIDIGFAEECEPWRLESRFFPSKIGGKPAWLDLQNIPNTEQLQCNYCKNPCIFLCQIYAPYEEDPKAFHRTIYVFICKNPDCCKENSNGNIKVLRSQLQRSNKFYPPDPPIEEKNWRTDIKYELVIERERYEPENKTDTSEQEMKTFQNLIESGQAGSLQTEKNVDSDLLQMASEIEDKTFLKFQKRVKSEPDQVIRYNRGGSPLYISSSHQPAEIPNCEICGEIRQFEFQVMPQLINYLKLEDVLNSIDWGILAIYTCKNSCIPQSKYVKEFAWKQDITKEIITQ